MMCRTLAFLILVGFIAGCTRYGTSPSGGPFARKPSSDPTIPTPPPANNSPLALGTPFQPGVSASDDNPIIPPRPPDSIRPAGNNALGTATPTGGPPHGDNSAAALTPWPRDGDPQPGQIALPLSPRAPSGVVPASGAAMAATAPTGPSSAALNITEVKKLAILAAERWAKVDTYEAVVTRKELTPAKEVNEDVVLYQYRKEPMSVFIRNLGESGKGREILYNPSKHGDKIYVMIGKGDSILPAGIKVPPVSPDDPRVREKSRYSIREAGLGTPIAKVANWVAKAESGKIPPDALRFLGTVNRKEYPYPLVGISLKLRPGDEAVMPNGGTRQWFFDPKPDSNSFGWPVLIIATEPDGREVEYYLFDKVKTQVRYTEADFAPERLGKK